MKIRKLLAAALVLVMVLAAVPVASLAEGVSTVASESANMQKLDTTWTALEAVEAKAVESNLSREEVIKAVYEAALNLEYVDKDSFSDFTDDGFFFTIDGMYSAYSYRLHNSPTMNRDNKEESAYIYTVTPDYQVVKTTSSDLRGTCGAAGSPNVLLVGPNYNESCTTPGYYDSSFTDQYMTEADSIASATGGTCTKLGGHNATGPNIAAAYTNKGVVIYDSHGSQSGTSSYLCLTTNTGILSSDYTNGWAVAYGSSEAWIDGRYIQNYVSGTLSCPFVWMAICEGMKKAGKGTTGTALLAAGAGGVYGYSQSVSFTGDYKYEGTFWTQMKNGKTVAEAIQTMKDTYGVPDPVSGGDAYPIVMSALDSFPSNPDTNQTVYCDWTLFGGSSDPEAITSATVADVDVITGKTAQVKLTIAPTNVDYTVTSYASSNTAVATVSSDGIVTGVKAGTATLTVKIKDNVANTTLTRTATITVTDFVGYVRVDSVEVGGEYIIVADGSVDGTTAYAVGNTVVYNSRYLNAVGVTVDDDNDTLSVSSSTDVNSITWIAGGSASAGYTWLNKGNNKYMGLDSGYYLIPSTTAVNWLYESDNSFNNQVDTDGYYWLSYSAYDSSASVPYQRYTTSKSAAAIRLYQYVSSSSEPTYYTVTFKDWDGTVLSTQQVLEGSNATAPADPTRTGYTFVGWDVSYNNITADTVVTAQYQINSYLVTFKDWDGTILKSENVQYGGSATPPANPTRTGYTFTGWYGSYTNITQNTICTALYDINTYTVQFVDWDGTVLKTQTVNYGGYATAPTNPEREGYTFTGWDVDFSNITADLIVTAQYEQNAQTYLKGDYDRNGTVNATDALLLLRAVMAGTEFSAEDIEICDMNDSGDLNATDALIILRQAMNG